ncbi:unnamed protein product [Caenorhabditis brenneri]
MHVVFRILRTPHLVLKTIVDVAEPKDLVALSMCSKRMWRLIKFHWNKKNKYELHVNPDLQWISFEHASDVEVYVPLIRGLNFSESYMTRKIEFVEIVGQRVLASFGDDCIRTNWMNEQVRAQTLIDYICDLFTMDIQKLTLEKPKAWFIDFIKNRQTRPLRSVFIDYDVPLTEEETELILTLNSNFLDVYAPIPENFQFHGQLLKYEILHFECGHWVTLDHLLNSEITQLSISKSKLTEHDINQFLKHLMTGGCPQLRVLSIKFQHFHSGNVFFDLWDKVIEVTEKRWFQRIDEINGNQMYPWIDEINESYDIVNNGKPVATIFWLSSELTVTVGQDKWLPN